MKSRIPPISEQPASCHPAAVFLVNPIRESCRSFPHTFPEYSQRLNLLFEKHLRITQPITISPFQEKQKYENVYNRHRNEPDFPDSEKEIAALARRFAEEVRETGRTRLLLQLILHAGLKSDNLETRMNNMREVLKARRTSPATWPNWKTCSSREELLKTPERTARPSLTAGAA